MKSVKIVGVLAAALGLLMIAAGGVAWGVTSSQLAAENITVPEDSTFFGGHFRGKQVTGPLGAFAQAETIKQHADEMTEGNSFAELGTLERQATAEGDVEAAKQYAEQRATVQTASFLRASLFTSVLAFGLSALMVGLGALFTLIGWALTRIGPINSAAASA